jgi:rare lipoprotein A (peptidoglycan hydrolase)/cell division septation protein DedD
MKVRIALFLFCLAAVPGLPAEDLWEGNAAVIRRGVFDVPGLFAASDSFPRNSLILVENIQNGKQVEVTILERINGAGNVFLLLSEQAAEQIGLSSDEVLPVRARIKMSPAGDVIGLPDDLTENPDPDINPPASLPPAAATDRFVAEAPVAEPQAAAAPVAEPQAAAAPVAEPQAAAAPVTEPQAAEAPTPEAEQEAAAEEAAAPAEQPEEPAAAALSPEQERLEKVSSRLPQKQVYMPPREDERYLVAAPEEEPAPEVALTAIAEEAEPPLAEAEEPEAVLEPEIAEEPEAAGEAAAATEAEISLAAAADTAVEEPELELPGLDQLEPRETRGMEAEPAPRTEVVSGPAPVPTPPAEDGAGEEAVPESGAAAFPLAELSPAPAPAPAAEPVERGELPLVQALPPSAYFLQLAAFSGRERAEKLAADLQPTYTVAVLQVMRQNRRLYKVLIGPLNQEESGTLLYRFRSLGYKDAFITRSD